MMQVVLIIFELFFFAGIPDYNTKLSCVYELVKTLPPSNHDTMKLLFGHLRRYAPSRFHHADKEKRYYDSSCNYTVFLSLAESSNSGRTIA